MAVGDGNYQREIGNQLLNLMHQLLGPRLRFRVPTRGGTPLLLDPGSNHPYFDERKGINIANPAHVLYGDKLDDPKVQQELFNRVYEDSEILKDVELPTSRITGFHNLSKLGQLYAAYKLAAAREVYPKLGEERRFGSSSRYIGEEDCKWLSRLLVDEDIEWVANFKINDQDFVLPLNIEERDVAHAASYGARLFYERGITSRVNQVYPKTCGQIAFLGAKVEDPEKTIMRSRKKILEIANKGHHHTKAFGGRIIDDRKDSVIKIDRVVFELYIDPGDSMGATVASAMTEAVAPYIQKLLKADRYVGCVPSNSFGRLTEIEGRVKIKDLARKSKDTGREWTGEEVADGIEALYLWAVGDNHRRATHIKGILNGVLAFATTMKQDTRAIEAAVYNGFSPMDYFELTTTELMPNYLATSWEREGGELVGKLKVPIPCGIAHKEAQEARMYYKLLGIESADQLAGMMGAVGLATNLSALSMLSTIGVTEGRGRKNGDGEARRGQV